MLTILIVTVINNFVFLVVESVICLFCFISAAMPPRGQSLRSVAQYALKPLISMWFLCEKSFWYGCCVRCLYFEIFLVLRLFDWCHLHSMLLYGAMCIIPFDVWFRWSSRFSLDHLFRSSCSLDFLLKKMCLLSLRVTLLVFTSLRQLHVLSQEP